jgi:integrase/recombinase XerD
MRDELAGYWVQQYEFDLRTRKLSAHTIKAYRTDLTEVLTLIADALRCPVDQLPVPAVSMTALRAAFARFAATRSSSSVARAWSTWNGWFGFLLTHHVVEGNPMQAIGRPRGNAKHPKPLRGEDSPERLLTTAAAPITGARTGWPQRDLAVIALLLCTGMRSAELLGLTMNDLAGRPGEYRIGVHGKGGKFRSIPLDDSLHTLIQSYLTSREVRFSRAKPRETFLVDIHGQPLQ